MLSGFRTLSFSLRVLISSCLVSCTLAITPVLGHDPINIPKALLLSVHAGALLVLLLLARQTFLRVLPRWIFSTLFFFMLALVLPLATTNSPIGEQFFGTWGRSTGIITYSSLVVLLMAGTLSASVFPQFDFRVVLHRVSYVVTGYVIIQYAQLDPIKWAISAPVATLGNINFTSAFLGLANTSFAFEMMSKKNNSLQRFHFLLILCINNLLIWQSGSIQGIALQFCGIWIMILLYVMKYKSRLVLAFYALPTMSLGALAALGSARVGPLGRVLEQETVLYRTDYWRAGLEMFKNNPLTGVGIDSYGDFYREYRDALAATRTGPQRITNTAHSVFIDLLAGGGLILGGAFILLFAGLMIMGSLKFLALGTESMLPIIGLSFGYFFFCCISINQIGVAVWGFLFLGVLMAQIAVTNQALELKRPSRNSKKDASLRNEDGLRASLDSQSSLGVFIPSAKLQLGLVFIGACLSFAVYAPNMFVDVQFQKQFREKNFEQLAVISRKWGAQTYHLDKAIEVAGQTNTEFALELSREAVNRNPRDFYAWATVLLLSSDERERKRAALQLQNLDPAYLGRLPLKQVLDSAVIS